jgi:hypothetical protein
MVICNNIMGMEKKVMYPPTICINMHGFPLQEGVRGRARLRLKARDDGSEC